MINATNETFHAEVLNSQVPVLVDFYADWCGPCRGMNPTLKEMDDEAGQRYKIVKVDASAQQELSARYNVSALPTFMVFKGGAVVETMLGSQTKQRLVESLLKGV